MTQPLLPTRGIFVPTRMIFYPDLPSAIIITWIQLRCLAWSGWDTPPFSVSELASLIGIHPARLNRHLSKLQDISALVCHTTGNGKLILSFPEEPTHKADNQAEAPNLSDSTILHSQQHVSSEAPSYFPDQIMGYLSFQEDEEEICY